MEHPKRFRGTVKKALASGLCGAVFATLALVSPMPVAAFTPIASGDLIASLVDGQVNEYSAAGSLVQTLIPSANVPTGSAFDGSGNLYVTEFGGNDILKVDATTGAVSVFSNDTILGDGTVFNSPESIAFGPGYTRMYVSDANRDGPGGGIHVIDSATGKGIGFYPLASSSGSEGTGESDWLAVNQSGALFMTNENPAQGIMQVDQTTGDIQQPSFVPKLPDIGYAMSFDQNGDLWVSDTSSILEYSPTGGFIKTIINTSFSQVFAAVFNPPYNAVYAGDLATGNIFSSDLSGNPLGTFNVGSGVDGLSVAGTILPGTGGTVPVVTDLKAIGPGGQPLNCPKSYGTNSCAGGPVSGGTQVTIKGIDFQPNSKVTFGGLPAVSKIVKNSHTIIAVSPPMSFYSLPSDASFDSASDVYVRVTDGCCEVSPQSASSRFTYFVPQIGALVFNGGHDVCTATVVTSAQHATVDTILTAGHCVAAGGTTSGPGSFNSNFEFAPGYYGPISCPGAPSLASPLSLKCGTAPYGIWSSVSLVSANYGWVDNNHCDTMSGCDHTYDFGYIDFNPKGGVSISAAVGGGLMITWSPEVGENWTLFGDNLGGQVYGAESGTALRQCTAQDITTTSSSQRAVNSPSCSVIIPGDSGGPWINDSNGVVHGIGAVNSQLGGSGYVLGTEMGLSAEVEFNST